MEEFPKFNKEDSTLAALCYIPFFLINILVPLYILIKNEGRYARFHAVQSLLIVVVSFIISTILSIITYIFLLLIIGATLAVTDETLGFLFSLYGGLFLTMIPAILFSLFYIMFELYLAYAALNGKFVNIPFISGFVLRHA